MIRCAEALSTARDGDAAIEEVAAKLGAGLDGATGDLAILFASAAYGEHFPQLVRRVWSETGASTLIGCSGQGIIGSGREMEDVPAVALLPGLLVLALKLPKVPGITTAARAERAPAVPIATATLAFMLLSFT